MISGQRCDLPYAARSEEQSGCQFSRVTACPFRRKGEDYPSEEKAKGNLWIGVQCNA